MTPERCIAMLVTKNVEQEGLLNEKWYGTPFKKVKLSDEFIARVTKVLHTPRENIEESKLPQLYSMETPTDSFNKKPSFELIP